MTGLSVRIDELVLDGLDRFDADAFRFALERELRSPLAPRRERASGSQGEAPHAVAARRVAAEVRRELA